MSQAALQLDAPREGGIPAPDLAFTVHGTPEPAGSKKTVPMGRGPGARWGVVDANPRAKGWKTQVAQRAGEAMAGRALFQGPLELRCAFYRARPKGHMGAKGLRPGAPTYPTVKPDTTKLLRAVEDAMTGVVWRDDAQVVVQIVCKLYGPERVEIEVREL